MKNDTVNDEEIWVILEPENILIYQVLKSSSSKEESL